MRSPSLRLAVAAAAVFAAFCAFLQLTLEDGAFPGSLRVDVTGAVATTGGERLDDLLRAAAGESRAAVVREVADRDDRSTHHLYVAAGPDRQAAGWLTNGFPGFVPSSTWIVHPAGELGGMDPRGTYRVFGGADAASLVAERFSDLGYETRVGAGTVSAGAMVGVFFGPLGPSTGVFVVLAALLIGIGTISNAKAYAIQRLHGRRRRSAALWDLRRLAPTAVGSLVLTAVASATALFAYNGGNQIVRFATVALAVYGVCLAVEVVIYLAALSLLWDGDIVAGIKGRLGLRRVMPLTYLIRLPALIIATSLLASTFAAAHAVADAAGAREQLGRAKDAARPFFDGHVPRDQESEYLAETGRWLKDEDALGRVILALPMAFADRPGATPEFLVVNDTYLSQNVVLAADGTRVTSAQPGTVLVLAPQSMPDSATKVERRLREQAELADSPTAVAFSTASIKPDQELFLYEPRPGARAPASVTGLPLAVVNADSGVFRDDDFAAYASQGRVLVTDVDEALQGTPESLLGPWITAYVPVAQGAAEELASRWFELRVQLASLLVALGVVLATAIGVAQLYVRGNAQKVLVRHLHGWSFGEMHRTLITAEVVMVAVVLGWSVLTSLTSGGGRAAGPVSATAGWQTPALAVLAFVNLGLLVTAVRAKVLSMVRTRSEETA